jgi:peptide/nickel transport system permease protein
MSTALAAPPSRLESVSPTWRRFRDAFRRHPTALIGGAILVAMIAVAILRQHNRPTGRQRSSARGAVGAVLVRHHARPRCLRSRVYGARVSLVVGLAVVAFATIVGLGVGS